MAKIVLVVDDDPAIQKTIGVYLQKKGYQVVAALDGQEGWDVFLDRFPDLIVADVLMPRMNGADFVKRVRGREEGTRTPIIVMTSISASMRFEKEAINKWGANDFITKPFDMQDLCEKIASRIGEGDADAAEPEADVKEGRFEDLSYGKLLRTCLDDAFMGMLNVKAGKAELLLYFRDGRPVGVRSNYLPELALGRVLVDLNLVGERAADEAFAHARAQGALLGEALRELGYLDTPSLNRALAAQAKEKAILPFSFEKGMFRLWRGPLVGERLQTIDLPLARLTLEGVAKHLRAERVQRPFAGKEKRVFAMDSTSRLSLEDFGFPPGELAFLREAALGMTLQEAQAAAKLPPTRLLQVLYALILMGLFRFKKTEREPRIKAEDPRALSPEELVARAAASLRDGSPGKAAELCRGALAKAPELTEAWMEFGRALAALPYEKRGGQQPEECFERAAELDRRSPAAYLEMARLFKQATLFKRAITFYELALERDPANQEAQREVKLARMRLRAEG